MNGDEFLQKTIKIRRLRHKLDDLKKIVVPQDKNYARRIILEKLPSIFDDMLEIMDESRTEMFGQNVWSAMVDLKSVLSEVYRCPEEKAVKIEDLLSVKTQERIRYYMSKIRVEKGITCKQICEESDTKLTRLHDFLIKGKLVGQRQIVKYAHFVFKHGYKLED